MTARTMTARTAATLTLLLALFGAPASVVWAQGGEDYDAVSGMWRERALWRPDARVRIAQQQLRDQGFYTGEPDGLMNPEFKRALWEFQRAKGLRSTADLDEPTQALLERTASPAASPATQK